MNLHKSVWTEALEMPDFKTDGDRNLEKLQKLVSLAEGYEKRVKEETELSKDQLRTRYVGKVDPKKRESLLSPQCPVTITNMKFHRHRIPLSRPSRRQHCFCFAPDDRQGGLCAHHLPTLDEPGRHPRSRWHAARR